MLIVGRRRRKNAARPRWNRWNPDERHFTLELDERLGRLLAARRRHRQRTRRARRGDELLHATRHARLLPAFECGARLFVVPEPLEHEPEVRPCAQVVGLQHDQPFEQAAGFVRLAGLQVTERQVLRERRILGELTDELFVDFDGPRIEAETKVNDGEKVLSLGVARLELQRLLELFFRLVDAVVLE